jgi:hypothetical protein
MNWLFLFVHQHYNQDRPQYNTSRSQFGGYIMEGKYYVYIQKLDGAVIYTGKGTGNRRYDKARRSNRWHDIVGDRISEVKSEIVKRFDNEEEAYQFEEKLIERYKSIGQSKANINIGRKHSLEIKQLISKKGQGKNNSMYGKKFSEEHRRKLSEGQRRRYANQ